MTAILWFLSIAHKRKIAMPGMIKTHGSMR
ncbi:hypothetical protein O203_02295 [Ectopseudomonas chengduensis]|nr:hypothetical protein O203_02295 [Pseudomonas chengduensis]